MDDLGAGFWLKLAGLFVIGGIALFVLLIFLIRAVYAWGFLGTFLLIAVLLGIVAWFVDRRNARGTA